MHSILRVGSYLCRSTQKPGRSMQKRARLERALLKCRVSGQSRALVGDAGGREFTEAIRGVPSPPWSWGSGRALGYDPSLGSFWDWMGTEPDPRSAGAQVGAAGCRGEGGEPLAGPNVGAHHGAWRGPCGSVPDGDCPASGLPISDLKPPPSSKDRQPGSKAAAFQMPADQAEQPHRAPAR
jgi:hypothetical protein